jgi:hypothetical protein
MNPEQFFSRLPKEVHALVGRKGFDSPEGFLVVMKSLRKQMDILIAKLERGLNDNPGSDTGERRVEGNSTKKSPRGRWEDIGWEDYEGSD